MSVKLSSSEFACKLVAHKCTRMYIRGRGIYGVIQQKSVLNVSKIRLRYFFAVFLVSVPSIFKKANGKRLFRTDKDVGGSNQQRCFCGAKTRVQKLTRRSIFERAMDGGGSKQNRVRTANSQLKNEHGRSFFSVPAVNFCSRLVSILSICKKANGKRLFRTDTDVRGANQQ